MRQNLEDLRSMKIKLRDSKENQDDDAPEEDENFMLLVKRLGKFFGKNDKSSFYAKRKKHFRKKEASTSTQDVTCYECGKQGHIKPDCPKLPNGRLLFAVLLQFEVTALVRTLSPLYFLQTTCTFFLTSDSFEFTMLESESTCF